MMVGTYIAMRPWRWTVVLSRCDDVADIASTNATSRAVCHQGATRRREVHDAARGEATAVETLGSLESNRRSSCCPPIL